MDSVKANGQALTEVGATKADHRPAQQAAINRAIAAAFLDLDKHVAWNGAYSLDQVVVRRTEEGWTGIVKAHRNGSQYVAFVNAASFVECLELLGEFADRGVLAYAPDKYPPKPWWRK